MLRRTLIVGGWRSAILLFAFGLSTQGFDLDTSSTCQMVNPYDHIALLNHHEKEDVSHCPSESIRRTDSASDLPSAADVSHRVPQIDYISGHAALLRIHVTVLATLQSAHPSDPSFDLRFRDFTEEIGVLKSWMVIAEGLSSFYPTTTPPKLAKELKLDWVRLWGNTSSYQGNATISLLVPLQPQPTSLDVSFGTFLVSLWGQEKHHPARLVAQRYATLFREHYSPSSSTKRNNAAYRNFYDETIASVTLQGQTTIVVPTSPQVPPTALPNDSTSSYWSWLWYTIALFSWLLFVQSKTKEITAKWNDTSATSETAFDLPLNTPVGPNDSDGQNSILCVPANAFGQHCFVQSRDDESTDITVLATNHKRLFAEMDFVQTPPTLLRQIINPLSLERVAAFIDTQPPLRPQWPAATWNRTSLSSVSLQRGHDHVIDATPPVIQRDLINDLAPSNVPCPVNPILNSPHRPLLLGNETVGQTSSPPFDGHEQGGVDPTVEFLILAERDSTMLPDPTIASTKQTKILEDNEDKHSTYFETSQIHPSNSPSGRATILPVGVEEDKSGEMASSAQARPIDAEKVQQAHQCTTISASSSDASPRQDRKRPATKSANSSSMQNSDDLRVHKRHSLEIPRDQEALTECLESDGLSNLPTEDRMFVSPKASTLQLAVAVDEGLCSSESPLSTHLEYENVQVSSVSVKSRSRSERQEGCLDGSTPSNISRGEQESIAFVANLTPFSDQWRSTEMDETEWEQDEIEFGNLHGDFESPVAGRSVGAIESLVDVSKRYTLQSKTAVRTKGVFATQETCRISESYAFSATVNPQGNVGGRQSESEGESIEQMVQSLGNVDSMLPDRVEAQAKGTMTIARQRVVGRSDRAEDMPDHSTDHLRLTNAEQDILRRAANSLQNSESEKEESDDVNPIGVPACVSTENHQEVSKSHFTSSLESPNSSYVSTLPPDSECSSRDSQLYGAYLAGPTLGSKLDFATDIHDMHDETNTTAAAVGKHEAHQRANGSLTEAQLFFTRRRLASSALPCRKMDDNADIMSTAAQMPSGLSSDFSSNNLTSDVNCPPAAACLPDVTPSVSLSSTVERFNMPSWKFDTDCAVVDVVDLTQSKKHRSNPSDAAKSSNAHRSTGNQPSTQNGSKPELAESNRLVRRKRTKSFRIRVPSKTKRKRLN
jgi:hypothetical protein